MQQKQSCPPYSSVPVHVGCEKRQEGTSTAHKHTPLSSFYAWRHLHNGGASAHRTSMRVHPNNYRPSNSRAAIVKRSSHARQTENGLWRIFTAGYLIENIHQTRLNNKRTELRGLQLSRCDYRDLELSYPSDGYTKTSNKRLTKRVRGSTHWQLGNGDGERLTDARGERKKNRGGCLWDVATAHPSRDGWAKGKNFNQDPKEVEKTKNIKNPTRSALTRDHRRHHNLVCILLLLRHRRKKQVSAPLFFLFCCF
jgi:hypothetical protein